MNDTAWIFLSLASGGLLGAFFFGGLWLTVRRLPTFDHPALAVICSLLLRTAVTLGGFFALSSGHWQRLLGCLAGFALARLLVRWATRIARQPESVQVAAQRENAA
jgi:F1F0 ATPase subunit 2